MPPRVRLEESDGRVDGQLCWTWKLDIGVECRLCRLCRMGIRKGGREWMGGESRGKGEGDRDVQLYFDHQPKCRLRTMYWKMNPTIVHGT